MIHIFPKAGSLDRDFQYVLTGDFRPPKKNEWYVSGATPEAYQAFEDFTIPFAIAKRVRTELIPAHYAIKF